MQVVFEACCTEPARLRLEIFELWISGCSVQEVTLHCMRELRRESDSSADVQLLNEDESYARLQRCIEQDVKDQYDVFGIIEHLIQYPSRFRFKKPLLQLSPDVLAKLIERYYSFDDALLREIAGKRVSTKLRKEVKNLCERVGIQLQSGIRQLENLRRISRSLMGEDEREERGLQLHQEIQNIFCLSESASKKISYMLFLLRYRFETLKRRLRTCSLSDLETLSAIVINNWTLPDCDDIDHAFLEKLRDVKIAVGSDRGFLDHYRRSVEAALSSKTDKASRLGARLPSLFKSILTIGSGLARSKELRDLFVGIVEQIVQPLCRLTLTNDELNDFFNALIDNMVIPLSASSSAVSQQNQLKSVFERFVRVIQKACILLYSKYLKLQSQRLRWIK